MTTTNECDLKEARRLALERFVELSYKDGWVEDHIFQFTICRHKESGFRIEVGTKGLLCVYLGSVYIETGHADEQYPSQAVHYAYQRIKAAMKAREDSAECHELMAALGRIRE